MCWFECMYLLARYSSILSFPLLSITKHKAYAMGYFKIYLRMSYNYLALMHSLQQFCFELTCIQRSYHEQLGTLGTPCMIWPTLRQYGLQVKKFSTVWWRTYWYDWNYPARWPAWNLKPMFMYTLNSIILHFDACKTLFRPNSSD